MTFEIQAHKCGLVKPVYAKQANTTYEHIQPEKQIKYEVIKWFVSVKNSEKFC